MTFVFLTARLGLDEATQSLRDLDHGLPQGGGNLAIRAGVEECAQRRRDPEAVQAPDCQAAAGAVLLLDPPA